LGRLPRDGWARRAAARHLPAASPLRPAPAPRSVVFAAEPAAALVDLLVRALHAPGARLPGDWGRGWRVVDDPTIEGALFGGGFDDAGFACAPVELAGDGQIGSLPATGRLRRPSFRDPPRPHAAHVVVRPGEVEPPAGGVLVTGFDTHRLAGERVALVLRGALVEDGRPVVPLAGAVLRTSPHELVARCVGGIGAVASSHLGIDTPALRFDGVEVEPFP